MFHRHIPCAAVLFCLQLTQAFAGPPEPGTKSEDPRIGHIRKFFLMKSSPLVAHAESFLEAADKYNLDFRLLPSLAIVETGGVRVFRNNNVFGWGNGTIKFASIAESIHVVAERLANGLPYRKKDTEGKLRAYNPRNSGYAPHVLGIMALLGPAVPAPRVSAGASTADKP
jgi:hypothetical protein